MIRLILFVMMFDGTMVTQDFRAWTCSSVEQCIQAIETCGRTGPVMLYATMTIDEIPISRMPGRSQTGIVYGFSCGLDLQG